MHSAEKSRSFLPFNKSSTPQYELLPIMLRHILRVFDNPSRMIAELFLMQFSKSGWSKFTSIRYTMCFLEIATSPSKTKNTDAIDSPSSKSIVFLGSLMISISIRILINFDFGIDEKNGNYFKNFTWESFYYLETSPMILSKPLFVKQIKWVSSLHTIVAVLWRYLKVIEEIFYHENKIEEKT